MKSKISRKLYHLIIWGVGGCYEDDQDEGANLDEILIKKCDFPVPAHPYPPPPRIQAVPPPQSKPGFWKGNGGHRCIAAPTPGMPSPHTVELPSAWQTAPTATSEEPSVKPPTLSGTALACSSLLLHSVLLVQALLYLCSPPDFTLC